MKVQTMCVVGQRVYWISMWLVLLAGIPSNAVAAGRFKTLHKFTGKDGEYASGGLISDSVGNLYGTTYADNNGAGNVFELTRNQDGTWKEAVLHWFGSGNDGNFPG